MNILRLRRISSKLFLTLAYLAVTLQWLWIFATGLPPLIEAGVFDQFAPATRVEPAPTNKTMGYSPVLSIVAGVITLLFLIISVVVLLKLPKAITHTGEKVVHQATEIIIPVVTHHKTLPARKKRLVTRRTTIAIQLVLVLVPLVASIFIPAYQTITSQIITVLAMWLAGISTVCFTISWLVEPKATSRTRSRASRG